MNCRFLKSQQEFCVKRHVVEDKSATLKYYVVLGIPFNMSLSVFFLNLGQMVVLHVRYLPE